MDKEHGFGFLGRKKSCGLKKHGLRFLVKIPAALKIELQASFRYLSAPHMKCMNGLPEVDK